MWGRLASPWPAGLGLPPRGRRLSDNGSDHFLEADSSWFCAGVAVARPAGHGEAGRPWGGRSASLWPISASELAEALLCSWTFSREVGS